MSGIDFINTDAPVGLEQPFGSGYMKLTDAFYNEDTYDYAVTSEILDENHSMIGDLIINGHIDNLDHDTHKISISLSMNVNLEGNMEDIQSLFVV